MSPALPLFRSLITMPFAQREISQPLPKVVRYWDDYDDCWRTIGDLDTCEKLSIRDDGSISSIYLNKYSRLSRQAICHIVVNILTESDPTTACDWISNFKHIDKRTDASVLEVFISLHPFDLTLFWNNHILPELENPLQANCLRKILHTYCELRVGKWKPEFRSIISGLNAPQVDPFRVVKSGDCFIPADDQQKIYTYLDDLSTRSLADRPNDFYELRDAVAIILADQHGFRRGTIARLRSDLIRYHDSGAVHVTVPLIKKQEGSERIQITRRIKRDWCSIFRSFAALRKELTSDPKHHLMLTPAGVTAAVAGRTHLITGVRWSPSDFRHTAAQRLVDTGASADQLAEFMCHNNKLVGNVYFDHSPSQAERINRALAISPIYSGLAEVARTKTIDKDTLLGMPEEHQIAGVPHGIAISGIGACTLGQHLCRKNPVLSCYGCSKFLALRDADIHDEVVASLRPVVLDFAEAGRGSDHSPAYTQLQLSLTVASKIAQGIREVGDE